jgi:zinc protease
MDDVREHTLANGLAVLTREVHTAPIAAFFVWYRVGARDEPHGMSGASHWVEHMMFKRTQRLAPGDIGRMVEGVGGTFNAFTYEDATAYHETLPAEHLDLAMEIESDRMLNAVFDPEDVEAERTVIISEREGHEASPMFRLMEAVEAEAFRVHPYAHGVIGSKADLRSMTRDDLFGHYQQHYGPSNAVISAIGDFATDDLLNRIDDHFGGLPASSPPASPAEREPPQAEARRVEVHHPGPFPVLMLCHHIPERAHADCAPLLVLNSLLSGPPSGPFGGGGTLRTSRLYQRFIASGIAASVGADVGVNIDPSLHRILVVLHPGGAPESIERAVEEEIQRLHDEAPSEAELDRVVRQTRAKRAITLESVTAQAVQLGMLEIAASWRLAQTLTDDLRRVTPADVQRVARTYLREPARVTGWFLPAAANGAAA